MNYFHIEPEVAKLRAKGVVLEEMNVLWAAREGDTVRIAYDGVIEFKDPQGRVGLGGFECSCGFCTPDFDTFMRHKAVCDGKRKKTSRKFTNKRLG